MLLGLRVKNFALIREASLSFEEGFTVLSGETGAGKSILIDSISALLGAKTGRDMIRNGEEAAYLELVFSVERQELREKLAALSVFPEEDGTVIVSRKIQKNRSLSRINGEAATARQLKELAALLIDIHGQHEVQTLFSAEMHGEILDESLTPEGQAAKEAYAAAYRNYRALKKRERESADRAALLREADLLSFELKELSESGIRPGEEAELAAAYTRAKNAARLKEALGIAEEALRTDAVSEALRAVRSVVRYSDALGALEGQLTELDALLQDAEEAVRTERGEIESDEEGLNRLGERLDLIRHLEAKYDCDEAGLLDLCKEKETRAAEIEELIQSAARLKQLGLPWRPLRRSSGVFDTALPPRSRSVSSGSWPPLISRMRALKFASKSSPNIRNKAARVRNFIFAPIPAKRSSRCARLRAAASCLASCSRSARCSRQTTGSKP